MCEMASVVRLVCLCLCVSVVTCQFGFFPQREERRYATYQFNPNINTLRDRLTGILHLKPENQNSDRRFIFPFQNPGIANQNQQPQFQNQNRQPQFIQNYPDRNQQNQYYPNQNGNGFVTFPQQPNNFIENPDYLNGQNQGNFNGQNQFEPKSVEDPTVMFEDEVTGANGIPNAPPNGIPNVPPNGIPNQPPNGIPSEPPNGFPIQPINGFPNQPPNGIPNQPPNGIPNQPPNGIANQPPNGIPKEFPLSPLSYPDAPLAPLTPVPDAEKRNNFNFGPAGLFQETCQTVDRQPGNCINIVRCQPYIRILQDTRNNPQAVQILRRAHCGFEGNNPKVCCPIQGIPTSPPPVVTTTTTTTTVAPDPAPSGKVTSEDFVAYFPEPPVCGVSNASFSRVVGGVKAKLGDFPWMALLGYKSRRGPSARWLCGGSLISSKHVLTAAHCIHGRENDLFVVRLGELDLESETEGATPTDFLIKAKIKHEQYSATAFTNDIGILVLDKQVTFTDLIKPICIPKQVSLRSMTFEDYNPIIAGWGDTEFRGPSASHLMALQLPVVSNSFCAQAYSAYKAQTIDERVLCAGYKKGGRDACQGDSGGPLMQPIYDEVNYLTHFYQIGVVSYGRKCAEAGFPGVYSRITHFIPWLEEKVLGQAQS